MDSITVNSTIARFSAKLSLLPHLWEIKGERAKGKSLEDRKTLPGYLRSWQIESVK